MDPLELSWPKKIWRWLRIAAVSCGCLLLLALLVALAFSGRQISQAKKALKEVPALTDPNRAPIPQSVSYYSRDGKLLGSSKTQDRIVLGPRDIPSVMQKATVAIEDQRFYQHHGVDFVGLMRAAWADLKSGSSAQGGSTITMQYVRNVYLDFSKTANRKLQEVALALQLESIWTKQRIINAYLNTVCYGEGSYGIEAASLRYFGIHAKQLNLQQAALLAGLVQSPARLDPRKHPQAALNRRNTVLDEMYQQGMITLAQNQTAKRQPLGLRTLRSAEIPSEPGLVNLLEKELGQRLSHSQVTVGGLKVIATFRLSDIQKARRILRSAYNQVPGEKPVVAAAFVHAQSGRILVLAHSGSGQFDYSWQAQRQPGSTVKAFTAATILEGGGHLSDGVNNSPVHVQDGKHNYWIQPTQGGVQNIYDALRFSQNPASWRLYQRAKPNNVLRLQRRWGLTGMDANSAAALGGVRVGTNTLSLAGAFSVLAGDGKRAPVHAIQTITDNLGNTLWSDRSLQPKQLYPQEYARQMNIGLQRVVSDGFTKLRDNLSLANRRPLAGKTGTSEHNADAWFAGYTPQIAGAVWTGFPRSMRSMNGLPGGDVWGSTVPAHYWNQIASGLLQGTPVAHFSRPQGLQKIPNLHGLTRLGANARLNRWGFNNIKWNSRFSNTASPGQILGQDPQPGTWVEQSYPIQIRYATDQLPAPNVTGKTFLDAQKEIGSFARLDIRFQVSSQPLGQVLSQDPQPGFALPYKGVLHVVIATQAGPTRQVIKRVPYVPSDSELALLRSQLAEANARANKPNPSRIVLPGLSGLTPVQAQMVLSSMGLSAQIRGSGSQVISQSPSPGTQVTLDQSIFLRVGR